MCVRWAWEFSKTRSQVLHGKTFLDDMASKLDELPVVWLVVLLDDPPNMNDIHLGITGCECRNDEFN